MVFGHKVARWTPIVCRFKASVSCMEWMRPIFRYICTPYCTCTFGVAQADLARGFYIRLGVFYCALFVLASDIQVCVINLFPDTWFLSVIEGNGSYLGTADIWGLVFLERAMFVDI
jgi:hypothetical protein